jgi:hypothetical protein
MVSDSATFSLLGRESILRSQRAAQLLNNSAICYGIRRFITMATRANHSPLSWVTMIKSVPPHPILLACILSLLSLFWKNKSKLLWHHIVALVCVHCCHDMTLWPTLFSWHHLIASVSVYTVLMTSPYCLCVCAHWPPLWSSGQSSWLQIRRPGFDSRRYQEKVVDLERGPLSLVSTTEELLDRKV